MCARLSLNTNINATKLHDPPHFLHVFAAKKSHFQLSNTEEITQKTKANLRNNQKPTTTHHKCRRSETLRLSASDYPLAQGAFLMIATAQVVMNCVADVLYATLDPRVGGR